MGLGMLNRKWQGQLYPSAGEGKNFSGRQHAVNSYGNTMFDTQSFFSQILGYIEHSDVAAGMSPNYVYNDASQPGYGNIQAAQTKMPTFLCPSNGIRQPDPQGYGTTDYMPLAYTDIGPPVQYMSGSDPLYPATAPTAYAVDPGQDRPQQRFRSAVLGWRQDVGDHRRYLAHSGAG